MDLMKALTSPYMKKELPEMNVGDTVSDHVKIKEGSRERIHHRSPHFLRRRLREGFPGPRAQRGRRGDRSSRQGPQSEALLPA